MKIRIEPNFTDGVLIITEDGLIIESVGKVAGIDLEIALLIRKKALPDFVRIIEEALVKEAEA